MRREALNRLERNSCMPDTFKLKVSSAREHWSCCWLRVAHRVRHGLFGHFLVHPDSRQIVDR